MALLREPKVNGAESVAMVVHSHGIVGLEFISKICSRKGGGSQHSSFFQTKQERSSSEQRHLEEGLLNLVCIPGYHPTILIPVLISKSIPMPIQIIILYEF